tara:strand:- start:630 stop:1367 length:738 start_codon:yes stop_codon:yes gene_type:complete
MNNNFVVESTLSKKTTEISGFIFLHQKRVHDYFSLKENNQQLLKDNNTLVRENQVLKKILLIDTLPQELAKTNHFIAQAKIVKNTWNKKQNYMIINKGDADGITTNMGVTNNNKLVGIVHSVSNNFSTIISLINTDLMISSKIQSSGHYGSLTWDGINPSQMKLHDIPKHADIKIGDTIITSGYSNIFPEGVNIGVIGNYIIQKNTNFLEISVDLFIDFTSIGYIYIIETAMKEERKLIEKQIAR